MSFRLPAAAFAVFLVAGPAAAQLDPEPKTPYLWRVVLKAEPHPLLSPAFRGQLTRDLSAALQPALGPLGTLDVVDLAEVPRDKWEPLWQQFEDKGFAALDAPRDLTGVKTHFLKVGHADGRYLLESRQHDGFAGLASPVVRKQAVRAPELVGRTAGLMLDRDFGLEGTAEAVFGKADEAKVTVRGGQLGPVDKFVKVGDVFAVSRVEKTERPAPPPARTATGKVIVPPPGTVPPPGLTSKPREFTLLRVTEVGPNGVLRCGVLSQYKSALPAKDPGRPSDPLLGYRCLKLGTVESPVTVRLVSSDGTVQKTPQGVTVRGTEEGFAADTNPRDTFDFKDGVYRSGRPLANVACITVSLGKGTGSGKAFAVPVLGPDPVALRFETTEAAQRKAEFAREVVAASTRVADARNAQAICFDATAKLIEKQKNAEALARARGGFQAADAADKGVSDELTRLKEQMAAFPDGPKLVAAIEHQLVALRQYNVQLDAHVKTLEAVVKLENDPVAAARDVRARELAKLIDLLVARGDVDEALNAYNQILTLAPDNADAKARRDKLKADWTPKTDAHAKARDYLLRTWPAVATVPDFRDSAKRVEDAVKVCMDNGDRLALRKLLNVFSGAAVKLNELAAGLDATNPTDLKLLDDAKKVGEALAALEAKITAFVK